VAKTGTEVADGATVLGSGVGFPAELQLARASMNIMDTIFAIVDFTLISTWVWSVQG
jgi:hypothetical protein